MRKQVLAAPLALVLLCVSGSSARSADAGTHLLPAAPTGADSVVLSAAFVDGYLPADADEAVQLWNVGAAAADVGGWSVADSTGRAAFPTGTAIEPGRWVWLARDAGAFARSFGHPPDWAWGAAASGVGKLITAGGGPTLANAGDVIYVEDSRGRTVDVLAYGKAPAPGEGWVGAGVVAYRLPTVSAAHQVLYRKLDPDTGQPVADSDRLADWASDPDDAALGRRLRFPGWDVETRLATVRTRAAGQWELAVAPDVLASFLLARLGHADAAIDLMAYTFEQPAVADLLAEKAKSGVRVRVLVDGSPAGGITYQERWCLDRIAGAGGAVYFMDNGGEVSARYRSAHAKLAVVDGRWAMVGSENPTLASAPLDDCADGTLGRRGIWLGTDAPAVVSWVQDVFALDLDPDHHVDIRPFQPRDPSRGSPAPDFEPDRLGGGAGYRPVVTAPLVTYGTFPVELVTAPENSLAPDAGLSRLLAGAGAGDEVLVEQLDEPLWWSGTQAGAANANPRVAGYIEAAEHGARVRVLLDGYFDSPGDAGSNANTVQALASLGRRHGLDLDARLGNPSGLGIHNKMVLVRLGAEPAAAFWVHVGSLNGTETAHKANREAVVQVQSQAMYEYLARVFTSDWSAGSPAPAWLPAVARGALR